MLLSINWLTVKHCVVNSVNFDNGAVLQPGYRLRSKDGGRRQSHKLNFSVAGSIVNALYPQHRRGAESAQHPASWRDVGLLYTQRDPAFLPIRET